MCQSTHRFALLCDCVQVLGLFDTNTELWTGRVAMLGVTGLALVEYFVKHDALFG